MQNPATNKATSVLGDRLGTHFATHFAATKKASSVLERKKQNIPKQLHYSEVWHTQTEGLPERQTPLGHVFLWALKFRPGPLTPPSLPDPTPLAAKDCPGLGDPNTFKIA